MNVSYQHGSSGRSHRQADGGLHPFERFLLRHYASNLIHTTHRLAKHKRDKQQARIADWLLNHLEWVGWSKPWSLSPTVFDTEPRNIPDDAWDALEPILAHCRVFRTIPAASPLEKRLAWYCETLCLSPLESRIVGLLARASTLEPFDLLAQTYIKQKYEDGVLNHQTIALLTGDRLSAINSVLRPGKTLKGFAILEDRNRNYVQLSEAALGFVVLPTTKRGDLSEKLIGKARKSLLQWGDFDHLASDRDAVEKLVKAGLAGKEKGINILIYGEPGTGKTEFSSVLAERLGAKATYVGETDDQNGEPNRLERIASFALKQSIAARSGNLITVVDEADDVFLGVDADSGRDRTGSKVFMNRLVEECAAPTIWITNHPDRLGPAVMRRMSYAMRFPKPGLVRRAVIASRVAGRQRLKLDAKDVQRIAQLDVAPAILSSALRTARLVDGGVDAVVATVRSIQTVLGTPTSPMTSTSRSFDTSLSKVDIDLDHLTGRVLAAQDRGLTFCFHGLPGTGKSAFARHLAERLDIEVVEKRASDLLSMFVGGTEKLIAHAFEEAADRHAMLILDEADSFLRARSNAERSWEVTLVNEMLTRMESARNPVVCTTNLLDTLDPAMLRRFLFKVGFRTMTSVQARAAFQHYFRMEAPSALDGLEMLTPGDFALVARKAAVLGEGDSLKLLEMLRSEVALKPGAAKIRIGFRS